MKKLRPFLSLCIALISFAHGYAQTELPTDTEQSLAPTRYLQFGIWGDTKTPASLLSGSLGTTLGSNPGRCGRAVLLGSLGLNAGDYFSREQSGSFPSRGGGLFALELRCYLALRREREMSGIFLGPAAMFEMWAYRHNIYNIGYSIHTYSSVGLTLGYEHVFGERMRITVGILPTFPRLKSVNVYSQNGAQVYQESGLDGRNLHAFARIGWILKGKD